jgi:hypothetical protein
VLVVRARISLVTAEQRQLIDEARPGSKTHGVEPSRGGHRPVRFEEDLEILAFAVLHGHVAQLDQDAPDLHPCVGVRIGSSSSPGHQERPSCQASLANILR